MTENRKLITVAEAAEILNRSKSTIYAALNASPPRLRYQDVRKRLLLREGLEERFNRSTRPRADKPRPQASPAPVEQQPIHEDKWQQIAEVANELIDAEAWTTPPPWPPDRWAGLAGILDLARIEVATPCTPETER